MYIYIDTNMLIGKGLNIAQYLQFKNWVNENKIELFVHEFVLKECKLNISRQNIKIISDLRKVSKKYKVEFNTLPGDDECRELIDSSIDTLIQQLSITIIRYSTIKSQNTINDYFEGKNSFEHQVGDETARMASKKNFIDSIIAHDYLEFSKKNSDLESVLITNNTKDFQWLKQHEFYLIADYRAFINKFEPQLRNTIIENNNQDFLLIIAKNKSVIINLVTQFIEEEYGYFEIPTKSYPLSDIEVVVLPFEELLSDNDDCSDYDFSYNLDSIKTDENGMSLISVKFQLSFDLHVRYVAHILDLQSEGIYSYDDNQKLISQDIIEVLDDSGEGVIEIDHLSKVYITGWFNFKNIDLKRVSIEKLLSSNYELIIAEDQIILKPYDYIN